MSQKASNLPPRYNYPMQNNPNRADEKRLAIKRLLESIPAQVDAIKANRERDAQELRRFMRDREAGEQLKTPQWRCKRSRLPLEGWQEQPE